jgi:hypothetical protein
LRQDEKAACLPPPEAGETAGRLAKGNISHLTNKKIDQVADVDGDFLLYTVPNAEIASVRLCVPPYVS